MIPPLQQPCKGDKYYYPCITDGVGRGWDRMPCLRPPSELMVEARFKPDTFWLTAQPLCYISSLPTLLNFLGSVPLKLSWHNLQVGVSMVVSWPDSKVGNYMLSLYISCEVFQLENLFGISLPKSLWAGALATASVEWPRWVGCVVNGNLRGPGFIQKALNRENRQPTALSFPFHFQVKGNLAGLVNLRLMLLFDIAVWGSCCGNMIGVWAVFISFCLYSLCVWFTLEIYMYICI